MHEPQNKRQPGKETFWQKLKKRGKFCVEIFHILFAPFVSWLGLQLAGVREIDAIWHWLYANPVPAVGVFSGGFGVSYLLTLIFDHVKPKLATYIAYKRIVQGCGLVDFHDVRPPKRGGAFWTSRAPLMPARFAFSALRAGPHSATGIVRSARS